MTAKPLTHRRSTTDANQFPGAVLASLPYGCVDGFNEAAPVIPQRGGVVTKRKSLSKKLRFEVFKRDSFTCQYCGAKAPDVLLEVDHVKPVKEGGTNDILNLVTSCSACNSGKGPRELSDDTVIEKRRRQLEHLQARREQLDMMMQWAGGVVDLVEDQVEAINQFWGKVLPGGALTQHGKNCIRKSLRTFSVDEICEAMRVAKEQYIEFDGDQPVRDSVELALSKLDGICYVHRKEQENPDFKKLLYIRGILRKRVNLHTFDNAAALQLIEQAHADGVPVPAIQAVALNAESWEGFQDHLQGLVVAVSPLERDEGAV